MKIDADVIPERTESHLTVTRGRWRATVYIRHLGYLGLFMFLLACQQGSAECPLLAVPAGTDSVAFGQGHIRIDEVSGSCRLKAENYRQHVEIIVTYHDSKGIAQPFPETQQEPLVFVGVLQADRGAIAKEFFALPVSDVAGADVTRLTTRFIVELDKKDFADFADYTVVVGFRGGQL